MSSRLLDHIMTAVAALAAIALLAVVYIGETKGWTHERPTMHRNNSEEGRGPVDDTLEADDSQGSQSPTHIPLDLPASGTLPANESLSSNARRQAVLLSFGRKARRLFDAIRQVESGGDDAAVGDSGLAHGPLQIHLGCWLDGGGKAADYPAQAHDWETSKRIAIAYWARYGAVTDEQKARIWNGGPRGMSKTATLPYWHKVKKDLDK